MSKEPVSPSLLHKYCLVHNIPGPGCLCPLKDQDKRNPSFVEAAIIVDVLGGHPNSGEHFAKCSAGICGYFGTYFYRPLTYLIIINDLLMQCPFSGFIIGNLQSSTQNVRLRFLREYISDKPFISNNTTCIGTAISSSAQPRFHDEKRASFETLSCIIRSVCKL